jgi:hypothetical protein
MLLDNVVPLKTAFCGGWQIRHEGVAGKPIRTVEKGASVLSVSECGHKKEQQATGHIVEIES